MVIETGGRDWEGTQKTNDFAVESKKQGEQDGEKWLRNPIVRRYSFPIVGRKM